MTQEYVWPVRVYYEDTDAGGVVYHANYLCFMERARSECLREMGSPVIQIAENDKCLFVVRSLEMKFLRPALLDDALLVSVSVFSLKKASMKIFQEVRRQSDTGHEVLVKAVVELAMVSSKTFRPVAIPEHLNMVLNKRAQHNSDDE